MLKRLRRYVATIAREHASPGRLALACVVGGMIGATPFFGLHIFIAIGAALLLRLNRAAVYGAANISIPPLAPFLGAACIEVGARILTGHGATIGFHDVARSSPWRLAGAVFVAWVVGAPLVGGAIGAIIGAVVYAGARARERGVEVAARDPFDVVEGEARARYRHAPIGIRQYVRWKLRLDPAYRAIAAELPGRAHVVELGAGLATLAVLLALSSVQRTVHAVDWDDGKLAHARVAAKGLPITIERADVRQWTPPPCDAVVIVDVMHYFDEATQRAILVRAAASLREGGVLLVRDGDGGAKRGVTTRAFEWIAVRTRWNRSAEAPRWRSIAAIAEECAALGLDVSTRPLSGPLHPGNALVIARRRAARAGVT